VHPVSGGQPRRLTSSPAHDWQPAWSPDGDTIAFRSERDDGGVFLVAAFGGSERRVAPFGYRPRWSPDGASILVYDSVLVNTIETPRLLLVPVGGGPPREVLAGVVAKATGVRAAWHPDGRRISMWVTVRGGQQEFWTVPVDGEAVVVSRRDAGVERRLADAGVKLIDFVWSPSGRELFFEGRSRGVSNLWRMKVDPDTLAWTDGPERLTTGAGKDTGLAVSATGQTLAFSIRSERTRLWELPFDTATHKVTGPGRPITSEEADASFPEVSPDGRILYRRVRPGHEGLWVLDPASGEDSLVVEAIGGQFVGLPCWAPGGTRFAYLRSAPQAGREPGSPVASAELAANMQALEVVVRAPAGQERAVGLPSDLTMLVTDWSSDGQVMYGSCRVVPDGLAWVCAMAAPGAVGARGRPAVVAQRRGHSLYQARLSPDGRWVSFTAIDVRRPSVATVYVMPREGGPWTAVTEGQAFDDKLRWARDGRTVYFMSNRGGLFDLWGRAFDPVAGRPAGESFAVTHFQTPGRTILASLAEMEWAISPRGLVLPITESSAQIWLLDHVDQ
jgi:Tol biopolymer transport system component